MTTVREFSACGPCLTKGELIRETARFYVYRDGGERRISKTGNAHIEPCVSCRDHDRTQYPDGYMD